MSVTQDDETKDRTLQEYRADHGVRVERVSRNGYEERQEVIKVFGTREDEFKGFDGDVTKSRRKVQIADLPESNAYEILVGLAEAYGYDLQPK